ncbi:hypothetical protein IO89_15030 [Epilithonimonas lactis]|uniref:Uncharacterized protein n=1 Tax=Epilithonimonas lactis TaxID=421072 RepID=A0A085BG92_9FLAO|nr:hypothetical protein IO89_15030 [Epilithonimonas lactis]
MVLIHPPGPGSSLYTHLFTDRQVKGEENKDRYFYPSDVFPKSKSSKCEGENISFLKKMVLQQLVKRHCTDLKTPGSNDADDEFDIMGSRVVVNFFRPKK